MKETVFYIVGIALAVSAVLVSFIGLRSEKFPGKLSLVVILIFGVGAIGAGTFAVLYSKEHAEHREHELEKANEEIEKEQGSGPYEEEEAENPSGEAEPEEEGGESGSGMMGDAEAGGQVFVSAGCASCHTFEAAGSTGTTGPNLSESLAPDDSKEAIEEMIVDPEKEVVSGYSPGIMPQTFGESLSEEELANLVEFLYVNSPAGEGA